MTIKVGDRLASAVCETQVIVVRPPKEDLIVTCGGAPMVPLAEAPANAAGAPDGDEGTVLGKRYVLAEQGLELLCTKPGGGSLRVGDVVLPVKEAKSLPSSD